MSSKTGAPPALLRQREIGAKIFGPLIRGFAAVLGTEKTPEAVRKVIVSLAHEAGGRAVEVESQGAFQADVAAVPLVVLDGVGEGPRRELAGPGGQDRRLPVAEVGQGGVRAITDLSRLLDPAREATRRVHESTRAGDASTSGGLRRRPTLGPILRPRADVLGLLHHHQPRSLIDAGLSPGVSRRARSPARRPVLRLESGSTSARRRAGGGARASAWAAELTPSRPRRRRAHRAPSLEGWRRAGCAPPIGRGGGKIAERIRAAESPSFIRAVFDRRAGLARQDVRLGRWIGRPC
jgi:hypothetical protein